MVGSRQSHTFPPLLSFPLMGLVQWSRICLTYHKGQHIPARSAACKSGFLLPLGFIVASASLTFLCRGRSHDFRYLISQPTLPCRKHKTLQLPSHKENGVSGKAEEGCSPHLNSHHRWSEPHQLKKMVSPALGQ